MVAPQLWNDLPDEAHLEPTLSCFVRGWALTMSPGSILEDLWPIGCNAGPLSIAAVSSVHKSILLQPPGSDSLPLFSKSVFLS